MKLLDFSVKPDFYQLNSRNEWEKKILNFWNEWKNEKSYIVVQTSGSTGTPKRITVEKEAVRASAQATCEFFDLHNGMNALLCLPAKYIAGKMMLVRAEFAGLKLWITEPKLSIDLNRTIDFGAMTPSQCQSSLRSLTNIQTLILGGNSVSENLKMELNSFSTQVYETYGMTETISHIALKNISKNEEYFHTLPKVSVSLNPQNDTLNIDAPRISNEIIQTNDIAELKNEKQFKILGRIDNVVNSGGVKLVVEPLEKKIQERLQRNVLLYGEPDVLLGERLVMVVEGGEPIAVPSFAEIGLSKLETPKVVLYTHSFIRSENGKVRRKETIKNLKK